MRLDNIDFYSSEKLQQVIAQRFGQDIPLSDISDDALNIFKMSVNESIKNFERSMGFNKNSSNQYYMENKILLDFINKEQEKRMKVTKVQGDKIELVDPNKPGVTTTVDTKTVDMDIDDKGQTSIKPKSSAKINKPNVKIGQQVNMEDMDDDAKEFMKYLDSKGYTITSQGAGPKGISIEYQDRDGKTHTVDFKHGGVTEAHTDKNNDLEHIVAPEFKKLVHAMQQGMSKDELKKKFPKMDKQIDMITTDLKKVMEVIVSHLHLSKGVQIEESSLTLSGKESAALRLLVGADNFAMARRAFELARRGQSIPASLLRGFLPIIEKLETFIKGGVGAVARLKNLSSVIGENYEARLKKLLENEMETSEILLASQDIVDQITDMYEKIAEIKSSAVLELVDRMSNEMGQEKAQAFANQINPTLETLEQALSTARQGAQESVSVVKGEAPQPMAGDSDIDAGADMDIDTGDLGGDADIEGGDDFGASEPATGGKEPAGRAER